MDEKRIEEMKKLGDKKDLTPEEEARFKELFNEFLDERGWFYPHKKPRKDSDRQ